MGDYISREAAINMLIRESQADGAYGYLDAKSIEDALERMPSEDVQPVQHGVWMEENRRPRSAMFYCSECHRTAYDIQPTRDKTWAKRCRYAYCPNCGARMEQP